MSCCLCSLGTQKTLSSYSKLRHLSQDRNFSNNILAKIKSIMQYGVLIYRCCYFSTLKPTYLLQEKNSKVHTLYKDVRYLSATGKKR